MSKNRKKQSDRSGKDKSGRVDKSLRKILGSLQKQISAIQAPQPDPVVTPAQAIARLEDVERRMERLHKDNVAMIRKAAGHEARTRQLLGQYDVDDPEDERPIETPIATPTTTTPDESPTSPANGPVDLVEAERLAREAALF